MKKTIIPLLILSFFALPAISFAQTGSTSLSIGPSVGIPLNFEQFYKVGIGAGLRGYFSITPKGYITGNVNFMSFPEKFSNKNLNLISLKMGVSATLGNNVFLYGDGGLVAKTRKGDHSSTDPGAGLGLGFSIPVSNGGFVDIVPSVNAVFQHGKDMTYMDLYFAYRFRAKK